MKKLIFTLIFLNTAYAGFAQDSITTTIPLESVIEVEITSADTSSLSEYTLYQFNYYNRDSTVKAQFWAVSTDSLLELGEREVELCRVIQMNMGNNTNLRGRGIANRLILRDVYGGEIIFNFDEYGEFPTLRLCSTP